MRILTSIRIAAFAAVALSAAPSSAASLLEAIFGAPRRPVMENRDFQPPPPPADWNYGRRTASQPPAHIYGRPTSPLTPALGGAPLASQKKLPAGAPGSAANASSGKRTGGGGSLAVCVRTCDGFFFPVNYEGARGSDRYTEACQASCPGAETEVYFKPPSADMHSAANAKGRNYTQLPNAFKYRQGLDNTCTCKGTNETWAQALKGAEEIVGTRKTDIVITPEKSDQSVRPTAPGTASRTKDKLASADVAAPKAE